MSEGGREVKGRVSGGEGVRGGEEEGRVEGRLVRRAGLKWEG